MRLIRSCFPVTGYLADAVTVVIVVILGGLSLEVTLILAYSMKGMMSDKAIAMRHACLRLQLFVRNRTVATEAKLSSRITISELSLATSVPWIPIESPISASFKAGASLVPSPVTATMWPFFLRHCTIRSLSNGEDLAITQIFSTLSILCSSVSEDVISSDHLDVYTSILAIFHSFLHTSSTWIFEANKPQKGQATLWNFLMYFTIFRVYLSLQCRRSENTSQESSRELLSSEHELYHQESSSSKPRFSFSLN
nr:Uncharacterised protein [Ipomoea batatas]